MKEPGKKERRVAFDKEQVEKAARIAEAGGIVGLPKIGPSNKQSLSKLWRDLIAERAWFLTGKAFRRSKQRGVQKAFKEIEIAAKRLGKLLRDHDVFCFMTPRPKTDDDADPKPVVDARLAQEVLKTVAELAGMGKEPLGFDHRLAKSFGVNRWSAFEHLVSRLASIYERYSGKEVKFQRRVIGGYSQLVEGKFLSFAAQALRELQIVQNNGKPYSAEHMARAYRRVKTGKPRGDRRKKPKTKAGR